MDSVIFSVQLELLRGCMVQQGSEDLSIGER